ncbi:AMP-binding protein [Actinophytocola sp.]|uniref:AMP-binding protein n=1 Tax=Actinophytocola sp. TaxID=1872138 RepID=UPI0039C8BAFD
MTGELVHDLLDAAPREATAIAERGRTLRYADVADASWRLASWLRRGGVRPGDRVLIALSRSRALDVPALVHACSRVGAVFCVLHEHVVGPAFRHVLDDAAPVLAVSDNTVVLADAAACGVRTTGPDIELDADMGAATSATSTRTGSCTSRATATMSISSTASASARPRWKRPRWRCRGSCWPQCSRRQPQGRPSSSSRAP